MSTAGAHIVVLGGGVGGQVAAGELRRLLPARHRVTIVERDRRHAFAPSFLWVMTGDRHPDAVTRPLRDLVRPGVNLIHDEVRRIDRGARRLDLAGGTLEYDFLVIALGAELAPELVPRLAGEAHTFYSLDGSARLREALDSFEGSRVAVVVAGLPYKCPGAPHEGAMLIADYVRRRRHRRADVQLFTPSRNPCPWPGRPWDRP